MRWHLCDPHGTSTRTTDADDLFWARRRFAPIPKGWRVISDASYQTPAYQAKPELIELCSRCRRLPAEIGYAQCGTCRAAKRENYQKAKGIRGKNAKSETRAASMREFHAQEAPEKKEARRELLRLASIARHERNTAKRRASEARILRGIKQRREGQTAAARRERRRPMELEYQARYRAKRKQSH